MKKIFVLALLISLITACYAQKELAAGTYHVENKTFLVREGSGSMIISNPDYKYARKAAPLKVQNPLPMEKRDIHFDQEKVKLIVSETLKKKLSKLKENQETLSLSFVFEQNGTLANISYFVNKKTFITLEDIAKIDTKLKAELKASFTGKDYLQYEIITYSFPTIFF